MTRQNLILKRARILTAKFRQILKYFALDIEATKIAQLTGLNRNTINKYLLLVRKVIALECEQESPFLWKGFVSSVSDYGGNCPSGWWLISSSCTPVGGRFSLSLLGA